jgi:hypothetical protein
MRCAWRSFVGPATKKAYLAHAPAWTTTALISEDVKCEGHRNAERSSVELHVDTSMVGDAVHKVTLKLSLYHNIITTAFRRKENAGNTLLYGVQGNTPDFLDRVIIVFWREVSVGRASCWDEVLLDCKRLNGH